MENSKFYKEMPRYQSHKKVRALQIKRIIKLDTGGYQLIFEDEYSPINVTDDYVVRNLPPLAFNAINGYYVVYEDGYTSWSPKEAFEEGYTKL